MLLISDAASRRARASPSDGASGPHKLQPLLKLPRRSRRARAPWCATNGPGVGPKAAMNVVIVLAYILVLALFIFILLFGQSAQFEGTVIQKLHWFITEGLCEYSGSCIVKLGGKRGQKLLDLFGEYYCDRPNPTLQVSFFNGKTHTPACRKTRNSQDAEREPPFHLATALTPPAAAHADLLPLPGDVRLPHLRQLLIRPASGPLPLRNSLVRAERSQAAATFFQGVSPRPPARLLSLHAPTLLRYTGPLAVLISLGIFFLASFSDPGTITADNIDRHLIVRKPPQAASARTHTPRRCHCILLRP